MIHSIKKDLLVIAAGFILLIGIGGYSYYSKLPPNRVRLPLVKDCPLHLQACSAELPTGGQIHFQINPKQPSPTERLQLAATFQHVDPESVRVSFEGKDMYLGLLKYDLKRNVENDNQLVFGGEASLFVCSYGVMPWIVLVNVLDGGRVYEVPFEFETVYGSL